MKRLDLVLGLAVSLGFHTLLWGSSYFASGSGDDNGKRKKEEVPVIDVKFDQQEEEKEQPKPDEAKEAADAADASDAGESSAASLPEPMNTIAVSDITTVIKPSPPVAPRPESVNFNAPQSQRRAIEDSSKIPKFVDFSQLDKKPQVRYADSPRYPFEMQRQGINGTVVLNFIVDEKGNVRDPYEVSSSHREFVKPALDAIVKWRFSPGMKNGKAVTTRMQLPVAFKIQDDK